MIYITETIRKLNEHCRIRNQAVLCRSGKLCGILAGEEYYVGQPTH